MIIFLGINLEEHKKIEKALTKLFGIGKNLSKLILKKLKLKPEDCINNLSKENKQKFYIFLKKIESLLEINLKKQIYLNIERLKEIKCYRGFRHINKLPLRGQRTRTNATTIRYLGKKRKKKLKNKK